MTWFFQTIFTLETGDCLRATTKCKVNEYLISWKKASLLLNDIPLLSTFEALTPTKENLSDFSPSNETDYPLITKDEIKKEKDLMSLNINLQMD